MLFGVGVAIIVYKTVYKTYIVNIYIWVHTTKTRLLEVGGTKQEISMSRQPPQML